MPVNNNHPQSTLLTLRQRLITLLDSNISCALAGAAMPLCFAPYYVWWLCWLLPWPLLLAAAQADPAVRVRRGALFGIMYFGIGSSWFAQTLITELDFSWFTGVLCHLIIAGACALAPTIFCWLAGYMRRVEFAWPLLLTALWVVIEDIRFQAFGGGPWMSFGLSQVDSPLAGYFAILGETGTSGIVIIISYLLFRLLKKADWSHKIRTLLLPGALILLILQAGAALKSVEWTKETGDELSVALVQTATSQREKVIPDRQHSRLDRLSELSQPYLGNTDLVIWPETVVTLERREVIATLAPLHTQAVASKTTLLIGAFEASMSRYMFNTAFTLGYEGGQTYRKRHLVPFGETVPYPLSFMDDYVPGDQHRGLGNTLDLIAIRGGLTGVSICWEGAFSRDLTPLVRAGAGILINIANEAWFAGGPLPSQNLDAMRVRAMETGRPAIRVANAGPGAIISASGQLSAYLPAGSAGSSAGVINPRYGATPYVAAGADFVLFFSFAIVSVIALFAYMSRRR